jgi:hypothetical protein
MITVLIEYGSALYWALLFLGIYLTTIFAEQRLDTLRPNIWAALTALFVFGFTNFNPESISLGMAFIAYLLVGVGFATFKWMNLVLQIKMFTKHLAPLVDSNWTLRNITQQEFKPNDSRDGVMTLPPDPYEFRTRLWLWFIYWPSFTFLRFLTIFHTKIAKAVWGTFYRISSKVYDR